MESIDTGDEKLLSRILDRLTDVQPKAPASAQPRKPAPRADRPWSLPGIHGATRVVTSFGSVPAQLVRPGDSLRTQAGGYERVKRITDYRIDEDFLRRWPDAAPVVLGRNSIAQRIPTHDVLLSPAQDVALQPAPYETRLVPARDLSGVRAKIDANLGGLVYYQFHLAREARINCEGIWVPAELA